MVERVPALRGWSRAALGVLLVALTASAASAQDSDVPPWQSRVSAGVVWNGHPTAQVPIQEGRVSDLSTDNGVALLYDLSRRIATNTDVQVGFGYFTLPSQVSTPRRGLDGFRSGELHVGVVYSTSGPRLLNPHIGALIVGMGGDVAASRDATSPARVSLASKLGPAVEAGVLIGGCWSQSVGLDISVRRSALRTTVSGGGPYEVGRWMLAVGLSVRHGSRKDGE